MAGTLDKIEARRARARAKSQLEDAVQQLEAFDQELARRFRREIRQATKAPKAAAQGRYPGFVMSGWQGNGVRSWSSSKASRGVYIHYAKLPKDPRRWKRLALAFLGQRNPVGMMFETAGSANKVRFGGVSRSYAYKGQRRRHKLNGQGRSFIENMPGGPYRVVDPVARQYGSYVSTQLRQAANALEAEVDKQLARRGY